MMHDGPLADNSVRRDQRLQPEPLLDPYLPLTRLACRDQVPTTVPTPPPRASALRRVTPLHRGLFARPQDYRPHS
jgi:hypothetical protein